MPIVGPDGNNAPGFVNGIPAWLYYAIEARAYTYRGREPDRPDFGIGLIDGQSNPSLPAAVWIARVRASFADLEGATLEDVRVRVVNEFVEIEIDINGYTVTMTP